MSEIQMVALLIAAVCLIAAGVHGYIFRSSTQNRQELQPVRWFLLGLAGGLILFTIFPNSTANGTAFGFGLGGAIAGFVAIWLVGMWYGREGVKIDGLQKQIEQLRAEIATANENTRKAQEETATAREEAAQLRADLQAVRSGGQGERIRETRVIPYRLKNRPDQTISLITGHLRDVTIADVWVNSENTNMQMSRYFEGTISATIRYYGARRKANGEVTEDIISKELRPQVDSFSVQPCALYVTSAGELAKSNNVKRIFHVAAVQGHINEGYRQVDNVEDCVSEALAKIDSKDLENEDITSILFPLLGSGRGRGNPETTAKKLIDATMNYLTQRAGSRIKQVYFLTWTTTDLQACQSVLNARNDLELVKSP